MKKITVCALFVVVFWTYSCFIQTSAIRLAGEEVRPPTDPAKVQVYLSEKDVPGKFVKIALVYAEEGVFGSPSFEKLADHLKMKAAALGANGLILGCLEKQLDFSDEDHEHASLPATNQAKGLAIFIER